MVLQLQNLFAEFSYCNKYYLDVNICKKILQQEFQMSARKKILQLSLESNKRLIIIKNSQPNLLSA